MNSYNNIIYLNNIIILLMSLSTGRRSWAGIPVDEKGLSNLSKCSSGLVSQSPASNCSSHTPGDVGEAQRHIGCKELGQKICFSKGILEGNRRGD